MRGLARSLPGIDRRVLNAAWQLQQTTGSAAPATLWQPRSVGTVAAALAEAGAWSLNGPARDLDAEAWTFTRRFDQPAGPGGGQGWVLGLEGLATLAQVFVNGEPVLQSSNMFRSHEVDLRGRLRPQGNELRIECAPLATALAQRRPRPRWRVPMLSQQQLRWWRTTLLGRTPGWSPAVAAVGPWRPVWLEPRHACRPVGLSLNAERVGQHGRVTIRLAFTGGRDAARAVQLTVQRGTQRVQAALALDADGAWQGVAEVAQADWWWPHTHGEPALYEASLQVTANDPGEGEAAEMNWPLGRLGFRSLAVDQQGDGFQLVVNDEPVFARGACWTPLDPLRLHAEPAAYRAALAQVQAAGLNMLRLPGTMVYEHDAFHEACDAHGVLLWQDLMFASMDYPAEDPTFRADVDEELSQQLARWQARPSLAVVCGNSEVSQQAAMWGADKSLWAPSLFHGTLPARVAEMLPGVPYWPSSAWGGALPFQPGAGTSSYYGVGAYRREPEDARRSGLRFATECLAFAQLPDNDGLARWRALQPALPLRPHGPGWKARVPRDLGAGWDFDDVRDHYVEQLYGERPDALRATDAERYITLGRAATAELVSGSLQRWRAADSRCAGALLWFLRDLQSGAGWGLLDELGRPKSAFHALARHAQPLHLGVTDDGLNGLTLHLSNERAQALPGRLQLTLLREGEVVVATAEAEWTAAPRRTQAMAVQALLSGFMDLNWVWRFGPPPADVLWARWAADDGSAACDQLHFITPIAWQAGAPAPLGRAALGLQALATPLPDSAVQLDISCRRAARSVHFTGEGWLASDEYFHLAPGQVRRIVLRPHPGTRPGWHGGVHAINALVPVLPTLGPSA
jgi:beta-mannosidase